ncbi:BsaWI family type II restriction enzyme [Acidobacteriota bacterium]
MQVQDIMDIYDSLRAQDPSSSFPDIWKVVRTRFLSIARDKKVGDVEQSWKSTSGKAFEKITIQIILSIVGQIDFAGEGIEAFSFYDLNPDRKKRLSNQFRRKCTDEIVEISSEPDIVIYKNERPKVLVSCKSSLRDRINMDLFWSEMYRQQGLIFTVVSGETSKEIGSCENPKKPRQLAESIYDRLYIVNGDIDYCEVIRPFSDLEIDLRRWLL